MVPLNGWSEFVPLPKPQPQRALPLTTLLRLLPKPNNVIGFEASSNHIAVFDKTRMQDQIPKS